jgi:multiple sugar transport system ATP-binding protein
LLYGLRPEALTLGERGLPGTVLMIEPTGPETYAVIDTAVGTLTARVPGRLVRQVGERVALAWEAGDAHLFDAQSERRLA